MTIKFDLFDRKCAERGATTEPARAELAGVNRSTLWRWRAGRQKPSLDVATHIAKTLDITVEELIGQSA